MAVNDVIQLNARFTMADDQIAENVFHVKVAVTGTESEVEDACVEYLETMYLEVNGFMATSLVTLDILFRNITAGTPTKTLSWDTFTGGAGGGVAQLPPGVAALVVGTTALAKVVARKFVPGFVTSAWLGGSWSAAVILALVDFAVAWVTPFSATGSAVELTPVVKSGSSSATFLFTDVVVRSEAAYQRRRRQGVGD